MKLAILKGNWSTYFDLCTVYISSGVITEDTTADSRIAVIEEYEDISITSAYLSS